MPFVYMYVHIYNYVYSVPVISNKNFLFKINSTCHLKFENIIILRDPEKSGLGE